MDAKGKWTPGPLTIKFPKGVSCGMLDRNPGTFPIVAPCPPFVFGEAIGIANKKADAMLWAAAPLMVEALEAALPDLNDNRLRDGDEVVNLVRAALRKARGGDNE